MTFGEFVYLDKDVITIEMHLALVVILTHSKVQLRCGYSVILDYNRMTFLPRTSQHILKGLLDLWGKCLNIKPSDTLNHLHISY